MTNDAAAMKLQELKAPEAPCHYDSACASAWQSGYDSGFADRAAMAERLADMTNSYHLAVDSVGKLQQEVDSLSAPAAQHKGAPVATFEGFVDGQPRFVMTGEALKVGAVLYAGADLARPSPAPVKSVGEDEEFNRIIDNLTAASTPAHRGYAEANLIAHIDSLLAAANAQWASRFKALNDALALLEASGKASDERYERLLAARTVADAPDWNAVQVCTWIGNQLMNQPGMFERGEVCKFVRSLGRDERLVKHFATPAAALDLPLHHDPISVDAYNKGFEAGLAAKVADAPAEPVGYFYQGHNGEGWVQAHDPMFLLTHTPLYAAPVAADQPAHDVSVREELERCAIWIKNIKPEELELWRATKVADIHRALRSQPDQQGDDK